MQLPAVCAKGIFSNLWLKDYESVERNVLNMFWGMNDSAAIPDNHRHLFALSEQVLSRDAWFNYVLEKDRLGE